MCRKPTKLNSNHEPPMPKRLMTLEDIRKQQRLNELEDQCKWMMSDDYWKTYEPSLEQFRTSPEEVEVSTPTNPWIKGCAQVGMVTFPLTVLLTIDYPLFSWQSILIPLGMFALTLLAGKVVEKITKFNNR